MTILNKLAATCKPSANMCLVFIASRCLHGAFKGNIAVVKSMMAEFADESNLAQAFSLLPMTWAFGVVIGYATFVLSVVCIC